MTLILDMASGTEYQGEELEIQSSRHSRAAGPENTQDMSHQLQLRLETVAAAQQTPDAYEQLAGIDLDAMIRAIED